MVKQSLFRKDGFVVCAHKIYYNHQNLCFLSLSKILWVKFFFTTCVKHDSEYTCLSRSATANGTVIVQSFSPQLITGGASGYLRQEFCELELLDEITKLRYEGQLPDHIQGKFGNPLIRAYQTWKGTNYVPELTHPALKWSAKDLLPLLPVITDAPWQIIEKKQAKKKKKNTGDIEGENDAPEIQSVFIAAGGSAPVNSRKKRKMMRISMQALKKLQLCI